MLLFSLTLKGSLTEHIPSYSVSPAAHWLNCSEERTDEHEQSMFTPETMKTERENGWARAEQVYTGDHEDEERTDEHEQSRFTPETMKTERENGWARAEQVYTGDHEDEERTDEHEQSMFTPETMKTERENGWARAEHVYTGDHEDGERERMSTSRAGLHRRPWKGLKRHMAESESASLVSQNHSFLL